MDRGSRRWLVALLVALLVAGGIWWMSWSRAPSPDVTPTAAVPAQAASRAPTPVPVARPPLELHGAGEQEDPGDPFGSIAGTVTSWSTGEPVADAEVTFVGPGGAASVTTDAGGRFVHRAAASDRLSLGMVTADGFLPYAPEVGLSPLQFMPRKGRRITDVRIQLRPALEYRGLVVSDAGEPVAGASVRLLGATSGERALAGLPGDFRTDAAGEFTFSAPDGAWLEANHPDHGVGRARMIGAALTEHRLRIELGDDLPAADAMIAGVVLDADGEPRAGVQVAAAMGEERPPSLDVTDGAGRFELADLVPGVYDVVARDRAHVPAVVPDVETGARDVELRLERGGAVEGRVTTMEGAPVVSASVVAMVHEGPLRRRPMRQVTVFDAEGFYRIEGLPPGAYTLVAAAQGRARGTKEPVQVGEGTVEVNLRLAGGATIRGRITDETSGAPLPLARVTVERGFGGGASVTPMLSTAITDADGRYEIGGVEAGRHSVTAAAFRHDLRTATGIEVADGEEVDGVDLELAASDPTGGGTRFDIVGIGAALGMDGEHLKIDAVLPDTGAERAGLQPGDRILAVEGAPIVDLGFEGAIQAIRGREGTVVVLTIRRGEADPAEARVTRARVKG